MADMSPIEPPPGSVPVHAPADDQELGNWKYHDVRAPVCCTTWPTRRRNLTVRVGTQRQLGPYELNLICDIIDKFGEGFPVPPSVQPEIMVSKKEKVDPLIKAFEDAGYPVGGTGPRSP